MPFKQFNPLPIEYPAAEFYILEALKMVADKSFEPFKKSHERFRSDLLWHKDKFEEVLSIMMLDYITLASAGEARWGRVKTGYYVEDLCDPCSRSKIPLIVTKYTPESISIATTKLFRNGGWGGGYGGKRWAKISEAILLYQKIPRTAFIDYCIDLSHNSGPCFNKGDYNIFTMRDGNTYKTFLDRKSAVKSPLDLIDTVFRFAYHNNITRLLINLLERAITLGFLEDWFKIHGEFASKYSVERIFSDYDPVEWGTETMGAHLEAQYDHDYDSDEDEDHDPDDDYDPSEEEHFDYYDHPSKKHDIALCNGDCHSCNFKGCAVNYLPSKSKTKKPNEGVTINVRKMVQL
jgi:hypothetical protein